MSHAPEGDADVAGFGQSESEADFASEHSSLTFALEMPGGPEHARDPDSPKGFAGADERFGSILNG